LENVFAYSFIIISWLLIFVVAQLCLFWFFFTLCLAMDVIGWLVAPLAQLLAAGALKVCVIGCKELIVDHLL
jgi:hypothetical protein